MQSIRETLDQAIEAFRQGNFSTAEELCQQVLIWEPANAEALRLLGQIAENTGDWDKTCHCIRTALSHQPGHPALCAALAKALLQRGFKWVAAGAVAEAEDCFREVLHYKPDSMEALCRLGWVQVSLGRYAEGAANYRKALEKQPDSADALINLGAALGFLSKQDEAVACFRKAIQLQPELAEAHFNLGTSLPVQGFVDESIMSLREAVRLKPNYLRAFSNLLLNLNYVPQAEPAALLAEHKRWEGIRRITMGDGVSAFREASLPPPSLSPDRRLRVGYVSPDFKTHVVACFVEPILAHHDPAQVEVYCYADVPHPDAVTARLQKLANVWRFTCGQSDEQVAEQVRRDQIDLLVDLSGHTSGTRLGAFTYKPAPVQISYLGYPATTGLSAIDYRLTDAVADPPGEPVGHAEELVRLPSSFCCYQRPQGVPNVNALPADTLGQITFGSLHGLFKLNARVVEVWSAILRALPASRLLFFRDTLVGSARERLRRLFADQGITGDRIALRSTTDGEFKQWPIYHKIDITLDTFPWSGHTTACESLWMGVPVVTLLGNRFAGRMVASVLTTLKLADWIATTPERYVELAVAKAKNRERLRRLRAKLREQVSTSPLCDGARFTRDLEATYRSLWHSYCEKTTSGGR